MNRETIDVKESFDGQVAEIVLKPAPANILTARMMGEISACLDEQAKVRSRKAIIFSGEGKHFSFGASVAEHLPGEVAGMLPKFHKFIGRILSCPVPTIAKVRGCCLGGGFELALACNFIFADRNAKFAVPEITLGVFPPAACLLLPLKCGDAFASEMILTGDSVDAEKLCVRGVVNRISDEGGLDADVLGFVEKQLLPKSASSLKIANAAARSIALNLYEKRIGDLEKLYLGRLMSTEDAVRGITSFIEKKKPEWTNA